MVTTVAPSLNCVRKPDVPLKTCVVCGRPFAWRKKWSRTWDEVNTCSEPCNGAWLRRIDP
ncbi:MAG: DUF2256 domain-containing protein [Proteobacteria bacterium]|jgi:hypothetical protein|nr:DUF2256 domain-containing protein [Pseudomonadota bacterium]